MRTTFVKKIENGWKVTLIEEMKGRKFLRGTLHLDTDHARACVWNWENGCGYSDKYPEDTGCWDIDLQARINPCVHDGGKSFGPTGAVCHNCSELLTAEDLR